MRCSACGAVHTPPQVLSPATQRALLSEVQLYGFSQVAKNLQCDRSVIEQAFGRIVKERSKVIAHVVPDAIAIQTVNQGNRETVLLIDATEMTILEAFLNHATLKTWLTTAAGTPTLIVISIDGRSLSLASDLYPQAEVCIPPILADREITSIVENTLRYRNTNDRRRNFVERLDLLHIPDEKLTPEEWDEIGVWSQASRALRRISLDLKRSLSEATGDFQKIAKEAITNLHETSLAVFLKAWLNPITSGVTNYWINVIVNPIDTMQNALSKITPQIPHRIFRSFLLLSTTSKPMLTGQAASLHQRLSSNNHP